MQCKTHPLQSFKQHSWLAQVYGITINETSLSIQGALAAHGWVNKKPGMGYSCEMKCSSYGNVGLAGRISMQLDIDIGQLVAELLLKLPGFYRPL